MEISQNFFLVCVITIKLLGFFFCILLGVCPSFCLFIYLPVHLSVHLSVCVSVCASASLFICQPVYLSVCTSAISSICPFVGLSVQHVCYPCLHSKFGSLDSAVGTVLGFHHFVLGAIPIIGMWDVSVVIKLDSVVYPRSLLHICVSCTNTDHTFLLKWEHKGSPL